MCRSTYQLQIIPGEIGATGQSFTGLTLATQELLTLLFEDLIIFAIFPFKLVHITDVMLLYPNVLTFISIKNIVECFLKGKTTLESKPH